MENRGSPGHMPETENGKTLAISAWAPATSNRRSLYRSHLPWEEGDCQVGKWNSRLVSPHPSQTIIPPESNISKCSTRLKETVAEGVLDSSQFGLPPQVPGSAGTVSRVQPRCESSSP